LFYKNFMLSHGTDERDSGVAFLTRGKRNRSDKARYSDLREERRSYFIKSDRLEEGIFIFNQGESRGRGMTEGRWA